MSLGLPEGRLSGVRSGPRLVRHGWGGSGLPPTPQLQGTPLTIVLALARQEELAKRVEREVGITTDSGPRTNSYYAGPHQEAEAVRGVRTVPRRVWRGWDVRESDGTCGACWNV